MSDVKELIDRLIDRLADLISKMTIRKLSETELEIHGEYEHLVRLHEILKQLGFEVYLEKEYDGYGIKTYYLRIMLH